MKSAACRRRVSKSRVEELGFKAVFLAPGKPSLKPQQGPEGLQFDLGTGGGRSAHLMVRVGSNEIFERDFSF